MPKIRKTCRDHLGPFHNIGWLDVKLPACSYVWWLQHSLNGKTPLHFVVEKKNADFLSWFLELVRYFAERQVASLENPRLTVAGLIRQTVNAPASNGATALHIAASLKMEASSAYHKTAILQLLLSHGAEFSARTDSKLRTELAKDPAVCFILLLISHHILHSSDTVLYGEWYMSMKFNPSIPKCLNWWSPKFSQAFALWISTVVQIWLRISCRVLAPHMQSCLPVCTLLVFEFFQPSTANTPAPILTIQDIKASFHARICILGCPKWNFILWPISPPKKKWKFQSEFMHDLESFVSKEASTQQWYDD